MSESTADQARRAVRNPYRATAERCFSCTALSVEATKATRTDGGHEPYHPEALRFHLTHRPGDPGADAPAVPRWMRPPIPPQD